VTARRWTSIRRAAAAALAAAGVLIWPSCATNPATGGNNEVYVLPKGQTGSENLRKFATIRGGGEGTGPWFSKHGKLLYLSIQDQAQPDGSESRVIAIHVPKGRGHKHH